MTRRHPPSVIFTKVKKMTIENQLQSINDTLNQILSIVSNTPAPGGPAQLGAGDPAQVATSAPPLAPIALAPPPAAVAQPTVAAPAPVTQGVVTHEDINAAAMAAQTRLNNSAPVIQVIQGAPFNAANIVSVPAHLLPQLKAALEAL